MPRYFEDQEPEEPEEERHDTELTLGPGTLVALFAGLLLICGLCFGLGYEVGHRGAAAAKTAATQHAAPAATPDEEPLQASGSISKPSAAAQTPVTQPPASDGGQPAGQAAAGANPAAQPSPATMGQSAPPPTPPAKPPVSATPSAAQPQVRPAFPGAESAPQSAQAGGGANVHAALPSANTLMVQVAAVSHPEDAEVLMNALRQHGYSATVRRDPSDGLIHVRVGPFATRDEANRMCRRLLDDGYNAIVQP
jgi:DedD protein